jgi:hypothetical protein
MRVVIVAGTIGGFVSWVYSQTIGTPLALPTAPAIAACCILGAVAAIVSVYLVANSDVNNIPRLIAFALICGVFWKPVIDSSISYVNQKKDASRTELRADATLQNLQSTPASPPKPAEVAAATDATTDLLKTSDRLSDPELQDKARKHTGELITVLATQGATEPAASVVALTQVKEAAASTGNPGLARDAEVEIRKLQVRATLPRPSASTPLRPALTPIELRPMSPAKTSTAARLTTVPH